jgi:hypothetical protein
VSSAELARGPLLAAHERMPTYAGHVPRSAGHLQATDLAIDTYASQPLYSGQYYRPSSRAVQAYAAASGASCAMAPLRRRQFYSCRRPQVRDRPGQQRHRSFPFAARIAATELDQLQQLVPGLAAFDQSGGLLPDGAFRHSHQRLPRQRLCLSFVLGQLAAGLGTDLHRSGASLWQPR